MLRWPFANPHVTPPFYPQVPPMHANDVILSRFLPRKNKRQNSRPETQKHKKYNLYYLSVALPVVNGRRKQELCSMCSFVITHVITIYEEHLHPGFVINYYRLRYERNSVARRPLPRTETENRITGSLFLHFYTTFGAKTAKGDNF